MAGLPRQPRSRVIQNLQRKHTQGPAAGSCHQDGLPDAVYVIEERFFFIFKCCFFVLNDESSRVLTFIFEYQVYCLFVCFSLKKEMNKKHLIVIELGRTDSPILVK